MGILLLVIILENELKRSISQRIKLLRKSAGLTQEEAAELVGLTYSAYVKLENAVNFPSLKVLIKISDVFNVPTDLILFGHIDKAKVGINEYDKLANLIKLIDVEKIGYTEGVLREIQALQGCEKKN